MRFFAAFQRGGQSLFEGHRVKYSGVIPAIAGAGQDARAGVSTPGGLSDQLDDMSRPAGPATDFIFRFPKSAFGLKRTGKCLRDGPFCCMTGG